MYDINLALSEKNIDLAKENVVLKKTLEQAQNTLDKEVLLEAETDRRHWRPKLKALEAQKDHEIRKLGNQVTDLKKKIQGLEPEGNNQKRDSTTGNSTQSEKQLPWSTIFMGTAGLLLLLMLYLLVASCKDEEEEDESENLKDLEEAEEGKQEKLHRKRS